jgi:hypothetical protein
LNPNSALRSFKTFANVVKKAVPVITFVLLAGAAGCTLLGRRPPPVYHTQGRITDNVYTSPTGNFKLRLPELSGTGVNIRDEVPSPGTLLLSISDDLCREFLVSQRPGNPGSLSLESWVDEKIIEPLKKSGFKVTGPKLLKTRYGPAVTVEYRQPNAAPCVQTIEKEGKRVHSNPDADVAWYVFYHSGSFYRLIYVLGVGSGLKDAWFVKKAPADEVLARFADGFRLVAAKDK